MRSQYNGNEKAESWSHRGRVPSCPLGGRRSPVRKPFPGGSVPAPEQAPSSAPLHVPHTFPIILLKAPCFSFDKHSFIHSKHLCPARQQVQQSSHMQGPLKMLLHVPKPSYLRPRVSGKQFHIPSSWPPSSTERIKTQGRLFTDFFLVLPYLFISIIWIQKSAQLNLTLQ